MGFAPSAAPLPIGRLAGVGAVVFLANAALLVLQLVASRLLAPFIGSDLYTWTSIIGVFMAGIALGNAYGGRLADRYPSPRTLAVLLVIGALAAAWMAVFYLLLKARPELCKLIPHGPRIPLLTAALCLPAGFVLSLLTPLAIKLGLPDVSRTGRVAGMVFSLSTLGCLLGNYVTGFYLIPAFTINALVYVAAGTLLALAVGVFVVLTVSPPAPAQRSEDRDQRSEESVGGSGLTSDLRPLTSGSDNPFAFADIRQAFVVVFLASFCGMTLELVASRVIAQHLGVSLYTWTGVIGVMLAGTALGNFTGGVLADRANRPRPGADPRKALAGTLIGAGVVTVLVLVVRSALTMASRSGAFDTYGLVSQIMICAFAMFFLPMFVLGMVSPQVIRLAVPDVAHVGRVAGRVYAWSTAGAIAGTFAAGYVLLSQLGTIWTILGVTVVLIAVASRVAPVLRHNVLLYLCAVAMGGVTGGVILEARRARDEDTVAVAETNYYTINVKQSSDGRLTLTLDHLIHSIVDPNDPTYIHYEHEYVQTEFYRAAGVPDPKVLVIGGGGYTFPRYAKVLNPLGRIDVVEIDPGVTKVAYDHLGLRRDLGIRDFNMDGRQFVAERADPGSYDLIIEDAVNDLSVPAHLLTKEYNDEVKAALKPDGVYLLTVIDEIEYGKLWRAAMRTLKETFPHVALLSAEAVPPDAPPPGADEDELEDWRKSRERWPLARRVYVIYASARPFDLAELRRLNEKAAGPGATAAAVAALGPAGVIGAVPFHTHLVPDATLAPFLKKDPGVKLTDQYAPVDNLMADVFRRRH